MSIVGWSVCQSGHALCSLSYLLFKSFIYFFSCVRDSVLGVHGCLSAAAGARPRVGGPTCPWCSNRRDQGEQTQAQPAGARLWVTGVCVSIVPVARASAGPDASSCSGTAGPGASNWGFWGSYWADCMSEPCCWGIHPVHMYIHVPTNRPPSCSARQGRRTRPLVPAGALCGQPCIHTYVLHTCPVCAYAYWEYIFSLATGRTGDVEPRQPFLSWTVGSNMILFPLTSTSWKSVTF